RAAREKDEQAALEKENQEKEAEKLYQRADQFYARARTQGMVDDERDTLRKLYQEVVDTYPASAAAAQAWKRLEELHRTPKPPPGPPPTQPAPAPPPTTPPATPPSQPSTPAPDTGRTPDPHAPADHAKPAKREVKLAFGMASFVAVRSGNATVYIQERAVTTGE